MNTELCIGWSVRSHRRLVLSAFFAMAALFPALPVTAQSTSRVNVDATGAESDKNSERPAVSADGRYVAFQSNATNLVPNDLNAAADVFVHDLQTGAIVRVSVHTDGTEGNANSERPAISESGRYVAFTSDASNLVAGDTATFDATTCAACTGSPDVFVHDRDPDGNGVLDEGNGTTVRVSVSSSGTAGNGESTRPSISGDGRYVAFRSEATNLVAGDTNGLRDVFLHDMQTGVTTRASETSSGTGGNGKSDRPVISGDGRYVAFYSDADNLVAGDNNAMRDVFVYDRTDGSMVRISVSSTGAEGNADSSRPAISSDGRFIVFYSDADNLVAGDTNALRDIFLHDRDPDGNGSFDTAGTTILVTNGTTGPSDGASSSPAISGDGSVLGFDSVATNLVPDDTNTFEDAFIYDRATATMTRLSACSALGVGGDDISSRPALSADGGIVAFQSAATNLVAGDTNAKDDIFVWDRDAATDASGCDEPPGTTNPPPTPSTRPCGAVGMLPLSLLLLGLTLMRRRN